MIIIFNILGIPNLMIFEKFYNQFARIYLNSLGKHFLKYPNQSN